MAMRHLFIVYMTAASCSARDVSLLLPTNHESNTWRLESGHPASSPSKVVIWTRHEQVGIGNALGGFGHVLLDAMIQDRELIIHSLIFEKFCEIMSCALEVPPAGWEEPHTKAGVDISRASHFQIHSFNSRMNAEEINDLSPFYAPLGCGDGGARDKAYQFGSLNKKDSSYTDSSTHRKQCMFASITRSLLNPGPGKRLKSEKDWLRSFYVGSSQRFDTVVAVDKRMSNQSASSSGSSTGICTREPVFDVVIHLRTLALIEDLSTDSGEPEDAQGKANRFIASDKFNDMVHCLASQLAAIYRKKSKKSQVAEPVTVYLATDAAMNVRETFAVRLGEAVAEAVLPDRNNWPSARNRLMEGWNRNGDERRRATTNIPFAHSTKHHHSHQHHVDEGNAQLEEQAQRLNESRKRPKVSWSWAVEIDYFTSSLPPAHFMLWTLHNNELTTDIWQRLVGTTAEWLFLSEGSRMLTIKGLKGGEKALPSSFAVSAAAFGRTSEVDYLLSSGKNGAMQCDWRGIGVFT